VDIFTVERRRKKLIAQVIKERSKSKSPKGKNTLGDFEKRSKKLLHIILIYTIINFVDRT
jgi:hypothetical protein